MKQPSMRLFWFYIQFAMLLIVLASILAAVMIRIDLNSLITFNQIFHIL